MKFIELQTLNDLLFSYYRANVLIKCTACKVFWNNSGSLAKEIDLKCPILHLRSDKLEQGKFDSKISILGVQKSQKWSILGEILFLLLNTLIVLDSTKKLVYHSLLSKEGLENLRF